MKPITLVFSESEALPKLSQPFTATHYKKISKLYDERKQFKSGNCVLNADICPFGTGFSCAATAATLIGIDCNELKGHGCFKVIEAVYNWGKDKRFLRTTKI